MLKYFTRAEDRKFIHSEIRRVEKTTLDTRSRISMVELVRFVSGCTIRNKEFFFFFFLMYEQSSFLRFESLETG